MMRNIVIDLVGRLDNKDLVSTDVISWGSPVPVFGDLKKSKIATVGLNPSNREFIDSAGKELNGSERRFHTLGSLGLNSWSEISENHIHKVIETCENYFSRNPYDSWFRALDFLLSDTKVSFYKKDSRACHLDLVPYATERKWSALTFGQRRQLLNMAGDTLGLLLRESTIELLVLNGIGVIDVFKEIFDINFKIDEVSDWSLPRSKCSDVRGYAYCGELTEINGRELEKHISIVGYNHNIQSSFGVTNKVKHSIREWLGSKAKEVGL